MYTFRRLAIKYYPFLIFGLIVLFLVVLVKRKDENHYSNGKYKYSVDFPDGWVKDHAKPREISYKSPDIVPVSEEPEAAITIVIDERYDDIDLAGHYNIIARDLSQAGVRILSDGRDILATKEAVWVEFQDVNGLQQHVWYFAFNRTKKLLIIQYRVSTNYIEKYRGTFKHFLESFKI